MNGYISNEAGGVLFLQLVARKDLSYNVTFEQMSAERERKSFGHLEEGNFSQK